MSPSHRYFPLVGAVALGLVHCRAESITVSDGGNPEAAWADTGSVEDTSSRGDTGSTAETGPNGDAAGDACLGAPGSGGPRVPSEHRAQATACNPTPGQFPPDAGGPSCSTDADCVPPLIRCLRGSCSYEHCLTDGDCPSQHVCGCSSDYYGGNAPHLNICVPADCHVDADCAAGGYCSPSRGPCGVFEGFYCHKPTDPCVNATTDCASCGGFACVYAPAVGLFVCGGSVCSG
jgi:hypothetical protein